MTWFDNNKEEYVLVTLKDVMELLGVHSVKAHKLLKQWEKWGLAVLIAQVGKVKIYKVKKEMLDSKIYL